MRDLGVRRLPRLLPDLVDLVADLGDLVLVAAALVVGDHGLQLLDLLLVLPASAGATKAGAVSRENAFFGAPPALFVRDRRGTRTNNDGLVIAAPRAAAPSTTYLLRLTSSSFFCLAMVLCVVGIR